MSRAPQVGLVRWSLSAARRLVAGAPLTAGDAAAWHPAYPTPDTVAALALALGACEAAGPLVRQPPWWVYGIRADGQVVGDIGFHGPPAAEGPVVVEIGYGVVPDQRGRGVATRACTLLLELAWRAGAETVLADTEPDNAPSRAVLGRNGFAVRADGCWEVHRPAGWAG